MSFLKYKLTPALAFMLVSAPQTYETTRSLLGSWVATQDGVPKMGGLVLHAIVFILVVTLLMKLLRRVSYNKVAHQER
jgi:hypothetical protein